MSLFKKIPVQPDDLETRKQKITDSLAPLNEDYVWEIADCDIKSTRSHFNLYLVKIDGEKLTRVQGFGLLELKPEKVKHLSELLVKHNPEAGFDITQVDIISKLMFGYYSSAGIQPHNIDDRWLKVVESQDINFIEIQAMRERIAKILPKINEFHRWNILESKNSLLGQFSLILEEHDEMNVIVLATAHFDHMVTSVIQARAYNLQLQNPQSTVSYKRLEYDHEMLGFYVSAKKNSEVKQ